MDRRKFIKTTGAGAVGMSLMPGMGFGNFDNTKPSYLFITNGPVILGIPLKEGGFITLQDMYIFCKEKWKDDDDLIRYPFPMISITPNAFELINDWVFIDDKQIEYLTDGSVYITKTDEFYSSLKFVGTELNGFDSKFKVGDRIYENTSIVTNIRGKEVYIVNGDATKSYPADNIVGRTDINKDFYGVWVFPPIFYEHYDAV